MGSKKKLKKFYCRFYNSGEFRKIEAENEEEAYKLATEKFGENLGKFTIGTLLKNGDKIPNTGIMLNR